MQSFFRSLRVERENYGLLAAIYFALFTSGIMTVMLGTLLPYIRDENSLSYAQSGLLLSAHQVGSLFAVLVVGMLPYAIGRKKSTLLMGAGTVVGLIMTTIFRNPLPLIAAFAFTGIGRGTMTNICNVVVSDVSGNRTGGLNVLHAVFAVGALLSPIIVLLFTGIGQSWKYAAWTAALLAAAALGFIARSKLSDTPSSKKSGESFIKDFWFWLNTMILLFYICAEASIMGWLVIYFEDTGVLSAASSKLTPTLLWVMMLLGRLSCAAVSSRVDKTRLLLVLALGFIASFAGMLMSRQPAICMVFLLGVGFSMAGIYPTTLSAMRGTISTFSAGFSIAIANIGGILMPGIVGAVADVYGLTGGVSTILAALAVMMLLIAIKLVLEKRGEKPPQNIKNNISKGE